MTIVNPSDSVERQNEKLVQIAEALMRRVEQKNEHSGLAYQQFERAALLEARVRERTEELERALDLLQLSNARLETANTEIQIGRANLNEAIESINEGFALFNTEGRLIQFNSRFCRWFEDIAPKLQEGLSFEDYVRLVSRSFYLALPEGQTPEDWARHRLQFHSEDHVVLNFRLISNKWLQVSEHRTARGGTVILQTDVSEIMRLERQERDKMRDAQAKTLQATLDHLNQGVCIFDADLKLVGWNQNMDGLLALPARHGVHGITFDSLLSILVEDLTFHDGYTLKQLRRWSTRASRKPITFEITRNNAETFRVFAQEMPDRGFVISFTDVTVEHAAAATLAQMNERLEKGVRDRTIELNEALKEAERANASKNRFVAAASHDLLQPLSAAKLFISSAADRLEDRTGLNSLRQAETALVNLENIIEALLDISRLDAGQAVFRVQSVELSAILEPLAEQLSPMAAEKGLSLELAPTDLTVRSDPSYLRRIMQNLMANAIKYTQTGKVGVWVEQGDGVARVHVKDTGPGIPPEDQQRIFQEFERCERDEKAPGLGLGLAIVERACVGLGHPLVLDSETGKGSTFSVELPLTARVVPQPGPVRPPFGNGDGPTLDGTIVLLVENDEALLSAMIQMLENQGAEVLSANSADAARELLDEIELAPDLLLFDYQLGPGPTGLDLWQWIQNEHGSIPGFIVSADRSQDLIKRCKAHGVPLLNKPVTKSTLFAALAELWEGTFVGGTGDQPSD